MKAYRELNLSQRSKFLTYTAPDESDTADRLKRRSRLPQPQAQGHGQEQGKILSAINMVHNLDVQDDHGDTALMIACGSKHDRVGGGNECNPSAVQAILGKGCKVNVVNRDGMTALMFAALHGEHEVVSRLCTLNAKLEVGQASKGGKTALLLAAEQDHVAVLETLLRYGADLAAKTQDDSHGSDVLMLCVNKNHVDMVRFLLQLNNKSIDINASALIISHGGLLPKNGRL